MNMRLSLFLLCLISLQLSGQISDPDPLRFEKEIQSFKSYDSKNTIVEADYLFIGSSSIRMWPTAAAFPSKVVLNRGFGGSHISDQLFYYDQLVLPYEAEKLIFYCGDNDIAHGKSPERVLEDFQRFVELDKERRGVRPVFFIAIKPSIARESMWTDMVEANALIKTYCQEHSHLSYIDIASPMMNDSEIRKDIFIEDGLHLNELGYALWNEALREALDH